MVARAVLVLLALAWAAQAGAGGAGLPRVELELERNEATVGDRVGLILRVFTEPGSTVGPPRVPREVGPVRIEPGGWEAPSAEGEPWVWSGSVAAYRPGAHEIPPVAVTVTDGDRSVELRTEPVGLEILSVLGDEEDPALADLKQPLSLEPDYGPLGIALGVLLLLLAVSAVVWWLQRRYGSRLAAAAPPDPFERLEPHVWVYRELQRLLQRRLAEQGLVAEFCAELTHITKRYLGGRYRVELLERTTTELPAALRQAGAPPRAIQNVRDLLERCDRVKFAREPMDAAACRGAVDEAYRIVDATRPADARPESERGAA